MDATCTISFEQLTDYAEGRMDAPTTRRMRTHIASCPRCRERQMFLSAAATALRESLADAANPALPSEAARAYARDLARLRASQPARSPLLAARRWIAQLALDSSRSGLTPALGTRSALGHQGQRLYQTDQHLITLWEESGSSYASDSSGSYVIGQIYRRDDGVCLIPESALFTAQQEGRVYEAALEEGEFHAQNLPPGKYLLQLWLKEDAAVIAAPDISIGEPGNP